MCCLEDQETFDVTQKLVRLNENQELEDADNAGEADNAGDGRYKVISKFPYCISAGEMNDEKKAEAEDEEMRCAQEIYEGYLAQEIEYPIVKNMIHNPDDLHLEAEEDNNKNNNQPVIQQN